MRAITISLAFAILACLSTIAHATDKARLKVPSIAFNELFNPLITMAMRARRALSPLDAGRWNLDRARHPRFASLRRRVMPVSACGATATSARVTNFPDGTSRRTVAAITKGFHPAKLST